jgi:hypothetical protein
MIELELVVLFTQREDGRVAMLKGGARGATIKTLNHLHLHSVSSCTVLSFLMSLAALSD